MKNLGIKYAPLLFTSLPKPEPKTWMECIGMQYKELVNCRILAFYLKQEEEHGFKKAFVDAIFSFLPDDVQHLNEEFYNEYDVVTEVSTDKGRVDIVIYGYSEEYPEGSAILIENKIEHGLNNPFDDYWNSIQVPDERKIGVVLTLRKESVPDQYINITHIQLLSRVIEGLGSRIVQAKPEHLVHLTDYYKTIKNMSKKDKATKELSFIYEHGKKIGQLREMLEEQEAQLKSLLGSSLTQINEEGISYKLNSTNSYTLTLTNSNHNLTIKHFINVHDVFSDRTIYFTGYIDRAGNESIFESYQKNRKDYESMVKKDQFLVLEAEQDWKMHYKLYEVFRSDLKVEELAQLGEVIKKYFESYVLPIEKKLLNSI